MDSNQSASKGEDQPVGSVSWNEVQEVIEKLNGQEKANYRLQNVGGKIANPWNFMTCMETSWNMWRIAVLMDIRLHMKMAVQ